MAEVLRGKLKGQTVTLHQWANDWFTIVEDPTRVIKPTSLRLTGKEQADWLANPYGMDKEFVLTLSGTFKRRNRRV